jgi:hypothetical protein
MWCQLFRWGTIIGLFLAGSAEVVYTEKCLAKSGKKGIFKTHEKVGFKQVLERYDGVLGFSKTNIHFEEREFDRKLGNGHAELVFRKSAA